MALLFNELDLFRDSVILKVLDDSSKSLGDIISGSLALTVVMMVSWTGMSNLLLQRC